MRNASDSSLKNTSDAIFKIALKLNTSWLAVILCIIVAGVSILSAPKSPLCLISVAAVGVAAFYCRRAILCESSTLTKDLLVSTGIMSSLYANIWAFKILIGVLMVSLRT